MRDPKQLKTRETFLWIVTFLSFILNIEYFGFK